MVASYSWSLTDSVGHAVKKYPPVPLPWKAHMMAGFNADDTQQLQRSYIFHLFGLVTPFFYMALSCWMGMNQLQARCTETGRLRTISIFTPAISTDFLGRLSTTEAFHCKQNRWKILFIILAIASYIAITHRGASSQHSQQHWYSVLEWSLHTF